MPEYSRFECVGGSGVEAEGATDKAQQQQPPSCRQQTTEARRHCAGWRQHEHYNEREVERKERERKKKKQS